MLELSDAAKAQLHHSLSTVDKPDLEGKCFRIMPNGDKQLTLRLAKPAPSDEVFEHEGDSVLALPKALEPYLRDRSLDIDSSGRLTLV